MAWTEAAASNRIDTATLYPLQKLPREGFAIRDAAARTEAEVGQIVDPMPNCRSCPRLARQGGLDISAMWGVKSLGLSSSNGLSILPDNSYFL